MSVLFVDETLDYVRGASAPLTAYPMTMHAWIYPDENKNHTALWIGQAASNVNGTGIRVNGLQATAYTFHGSFVEGTAGNVTLNTWHALGGVFATDDSRICYLDGTPGTEVTTAVTDESSLWDRASIGVLDRSSILGYFSGRIAEAAIWAVALDAGEMSALAAGYSPLLVRPSALVFYAPLVTTTYNDLIGNISLTASGTPAKAAHTRTIQPALTMIGHNAAAGGTILPTINGVVNSASINGVINAVSVNGVVST